MAVFYERQLSYLGRPLPSINRRKTALESIHVFYESLFHYRYLERRPAVSLSSWWPCYRSPSPRSRRGGGSQLPAHNYLFKRCRLNEPYQCRLEGPTLVIFDETLQYRYMPNFSFSSNNEKWEILYSEDIQYSISQAQSPSVAPCPQSYCLY